MTAQTVIAPDLPAYEALFADVLAAVEARLADILCDPAPSPADGLWEALRYGTLDGGKRLRAVFLIESARACGGTLENSLGAACAIELVHAQSLMHDDLPCMDDDDLRRGKPSVHKRYGEATAVLAGDALIAMAFGVLARETVLPSPLNAAALLDVIHEFSDVASMRGLVNGQYVDIRCEGKPYDGETLDYIHAYKTGALFRFAARAGARLAGADAAVIPIFDALGGTLGLCFQIVDDLLDIASTPEALGKTPGKDQVQQKATYPAFYGESASRERVLQLTAEAFTCLKTLRDDHGLDVSRLETLVRFVSSRLY